MNYLAHLYLSDDGTPESLVGALLGDFVKGDDHRNYPPAIQRAIMLHRQIDAFTNAHPVYRRSKGRIDPSFRHTRGILVDLFYDHFLARDWLDYHPHPLPEYTRWVYAAMSPYQHLFPPRLQQAFPFMLRDDWLYSYREMENVGRALQGLSRRLRVPNRLPQGLAELKRHYTGLEADFREFFGAVKSFVASTDVGAPR
jgi:acyl carrier protein phosphodiesterase